MPHPRFSSEEIVRRGEQLYQQKIREQAEPQHTGQMIVINFEKCASAAASRGPASTPAAEPGELSSAPTLSYPCRPGR